MASQAPPSSPSPPSAAIPVAPKPKRNATVYDAVAGRVSSQGFITKQLNFAPARDTTSSTTAAVPPEAVLFRRKNAPIRFAEHDIYFANEREPQLNLPDSDLLKALHCYTTDFYSRAAPGGGASDWRSLDETALIALGILVEEAGRLGGAADLVFTEGAQIIERPPSEKLRGQSSRSPPTQFNKSDDDRPSKKRRVKRAKATDIDE
ncbi:Uncharacterized protein BP5553_04934 [Venustampulla echinocandica]|uniref:Uncharacterized protein n=1 Tax=Venustampulla echinocandica TaxID=2656787 RepID=A0A370TPQ0_9HELO|nr:Uncharacterized protein BP5553_04934 [Venustampulla echinocandica]RDL37501.1 Uncharacterized protein BP5553_04934 [Venustampulla echinocandica]